MAIATALALAVTVGVTPATAQAGRRPNPTGHHLEHPCPDRHLRGCPPVAHAATRSFAIVQGAVYDAVNAIAGTPYEPYPVARAPAKATPTPAAIATAAHRVLLWMFPGQATSLQAQYDQSLAEIPDSRSKRGGIAVGGATASAMTAARTGDGAFSDATWRVGTAAREWRPTPPGFVNPATVGDPAWTPLRVTSPSTEYPSGHACFTTAIVTALRKFFGRDNMSFSAFSADSGTTRRFDNFTDAQAEVLEARIWAGVHYRSAVVHGEGLGAAVAREVLGNAFGRSDGRFE